MAREGEGNKQPVEGLRNVDGLIEFKVLTKCGFISPRRPLINHSPELMR